MCGYLYLHGKDEERSFAKPQGLHLDKAVVLGHNSFAYGQSETNSILIDAPVLLPQLSKAPEELIQVSTFNTSARVLNMENKHLGLFLVCHAHLYVTAFSELQGVLNQVDQDLLQPDHVSHKQREIDDRVTRLNSACVQ